MMKKTMILVMALVFIISATSDLNARAQRSKMMRHAGFGLKMAEKNMIPAGMLLRFKDKIGLSEAQVAKIEKMQYRFQESQIKTGADAKLIGLKLKAEFDKENVNRSAVVSLIKKVSAIKTDMQISKINYLLDVRSVLTKEQMEKIKELRAERRKRGMRRKFRQNAKGKFQKQRMR